MQPYKGRVLVAGATGRTGAEIVKRLRHYGIDFRLFVRSAQKAITLFGADAAGILRVGSIQDKEEARAALKGIDAVICAVGSNPADPESPPPSAIDRDGVQQLAALAKEAGARQFTLISSLGATREDHPLNKYGRVLSMKLEGENTVRAHFNTPEYSHTILRPGGLLDTPHSSTNWYSQQETQSPDLFQEETLLKQQFIHSLNRMPKTGHLSLYREKKRDSCLHQNTSRNLQYSQFSYTSDRAKRRLILFIKKRQKERLIAESNKLKSR